LPPSRSDSPDLAEGKRHRRGKLVLDLGDGWRDRDLDASGFTFYGKESAKKEVGRRRRMIVGERPVAG
jgi:hypothetical protein